MRMRRLIFLGYCPYCGRDVDTDFCDHCGKRTQEEEPQSANGTKSQPSTHPEKSAKTKNNV